jgi:hypothetical protein
MFKTDGRSSKRVPVKIRKVHTLWALIALVLVSPSFAAQHFDVIDPLMGEYEGFWTTSGGTRGRMTAQIRPLSNNSYDGFVLLSRSKTAVAAFKLNPATASDKNVISFKGTAINLGEEGELLSEIHGECKLEEGKITGTFQGDLGEGTIEAQKGNRKSPRIGAKLPKNALVLFDGKLSEHWQPNEWTITRDGFLQVGKGELRTKEKFANYHLHVEFRTPYMPIEQGQARGNSGVYLQSKYEVQVLDSFGLLPLKNNDCGGIYQVKAPRLNACLPPMEWQSFDITYIEGNRQKGELPTITIVHNGITVIDQARVPASLIENGTGGGNKDGTVLMLQDHGNPVQFRNIWVEPFFATERKR